MSKYLRMRVLALCIAMTTLTSQAIPVFADTTVQTVVQTQSNVSDWASDTVTKFMGDNFKSTYNYKFKCTRAEFAEILEKALTSLGYEFSEPTANPFKDTKNKSVIKLFNAGLLAGTSTNVFGANDTLTREQLAVIVCRVYDKLGVKMPTSVSYSIKDEAKVSTWARLSVKRAYMANVIKGDSTAYTPKAVVTREQAIVICSRTADTVKAIKQEQATKPVETPTNTVVTTNMYTYDTATKVIKITKSCTIDASVAGTPKEFNNVVVATGVNATLKGITVKEATLNPTATLTAYSCSIDQLHAREGTKFIADKPTTVMKLTTYGSVDVDAEDTIIKDVSIYESVKDKVNLAARLGIVTIDAPVTLNISEGILGTLNINSGDSRATLSVDTDKVNINKDDIDLIVDSVRLDTLSVGGDSSIEVSKNTKLKTLDVKEDGVGSVITLNSKYDINIKVAAKCTINKTTVRKDDKVTYEDGKFKIEKEGSSSSASTSVEATAIEEAETALTYALILDSNASQTSVKTDLYLPTKLKGCSITWSSSNEAVVSTMGKVKRIDKDTTVELKAKLLNGDSTSNKAFSVTVLAEEPGKGGGEGSQDGIVEDVTPILVESLNKVSIPTSTKDAFTIPLSVDSFPIEVSSSSTAVTIVKIANGTVVTPIQSTNDESVLLTLKATSGKYTGTRNVTITIPKKVTTPVDDEASIRAKLKAELTLITVPTSINNAVQLSKLSQNGYTVNCSSDNSALKVTAQDTSFLLEPNKIATVQTANLTVSITNGVYTESKTVAVTIPAEDTVVGETVTRELILADMEKILSTEILPTTIRTVTTVPLSYDSQYSSVGKYLVSLTTTSKQVKVTNSAGNISIDPNNVSLTHEVTAELNVTLTTVLQGVPVTYTKPLTVNIIPKHTDEEFKQLITDGFMARAYELHSLIPKKLTGTSEHIKYFHEYNVDGLDFGMGIQPQAYPNIDASAIDEKIRIDYYKDGTFTITPLVRDGSTVNLPVKFGTQYGADIIGTTNTFTIQLPDDSQVDNTAAWASAVIESEIFEIINEIDIQIVVPTDVGTTDIVIKDKHLKTELGRATIPSFTSKSSKFVGNTLVKLSKNAILGEYAYEIYQNSQIVKTGDLVNSAITEYNSKVLTFEQN